MASKGMDLCIQENYTTSLQYFDSLRTQYPEHPAGYFFTAAVIQSRMMDFETQTGRDDFYCEIDTAISLAKQWTENEPDNARAWFYLGAAKSYYSYQLGRENRYLKAIRSGLDCIGDLKKSLDLDPECCDALLGVGSYEYWRSYITRKINWLPFFSDHRKEGLAKLETVIDCGTFTRWAAISNLAWIYIEEKEYEKAITVSQKGLAAFPNTRFFLWPLAEAHFRNKDYKIAAVLFDQILASVNSETENNHYNEILLNYKLGQCYHELEQYELAMEHLNNAIRTTPAEEVEKRAREKQEKAFKLLAEINKKL